MEHTQHNRTTDTEQEKDGKKSHTPSEITFRRPDVRLYLFIFINFLFAPLLFWLLLSIFGERNQARACRST